MTPAGHEAARVDEHAERRTVRRATLLVVVSACCFGSISPLTVLALKGGAELQGIQAWRYATTALLLMAWAAWRGAPAATDPLLRWWRPQTVLIAGGGQMLVATLALMALRWIPAATEAFLFYTFPAWVAIFTAVRGHERLDRIRVVALMLALGGIAFMVGAPSAASLNPIGVAMALTAALVYAIYIPVLADLQRTRPALDVSRSIAVGGGIIFTVWALSTGALFAHFDTLVLAASVLQGVLSAGAFVGFLAGLSKLGAVRTAITSTVEPFWTALLGVLVLDQPVGAGTLIGGAAIMAAVLLLQRSAVSSAPLHSSSSREGDQERRPSS